MIYCTSEFPDEIVMFGSPEGTTWEWQHQGTINFGRWVLAQHSISNCQDTLCKALENPEHYEHIIVWPQFCVMKLCGSTLSRLKPFDPCNFGLHNRDPNVAGRYIPVVWFTFSSLFGAHLGEPIPMRCWHCWGPRWLSQVVWENRLKHRLGYKGEALPHPLRDLCSDAPSILHHWGCTLWFVIWKHPYFFAGVGRLKFTERVYAWMILLYDSRWHCFLQCAWKGNSS